MQTTNLNLVPKLEVSGAVPSLHLLQSEMVSSIQDKSSRRAWYLVKHRDKFALPLTGARLNGTPGEDDR